MTFSRTSRLALASGVAFFALSTAALAQDSTPTADNQAATDGGREILVTGSRIKIDPAKSAAPLEVITPEVIERNGISSPEQLNMYLTSSGSGADNLASNADVTSGAQRGTNGLSAANLRGQGSAATLVLLNGRRVAAHGLTGGAVDVNQIPFAAIERVEVLKDGASAIYGTDAVGGVINYITRKDYKGVGMTATTDVTEHGGGNIYSLSGIAGYGDLGTQGFNVMGAVSYRWNEILRGSQRDFVNGNQPNRGLSVDTRGTPIATVFNIGANTFQTPGGTLLTGLTLTAPNGANAASGGINTLDLPGGAGCESMDGGMAYDEQLWNTPSAQYACSWDTGRAAVIQQPIQTLTYYGRATKSLGASEAYLELAGSKADSAKSFSNAQLSANTTNLPWAYPLNSLTSATYNQVFNQIRAAFAGNPAQVAALDARYGKPISGRWRCVPCGPREYDTDTKTLRIAGGVDGPLPWSGWDYRAGLSWARSESSSLLGGGYYYRGTLANGAPDPLAPIAPGATQPGLLGLINAGILNPFSIAQSDAAIAGLNAISAEGTTLYGGTYKTLQADASISGPLFRLPGGDAQVALGVDYRRETYAFNGSAAAAATAPVIFLAAFDNVNALMPKNRNVKAAYGELSLPLLDSLTVTGALRIDDYTGFGSTTNPRVTARFEPINWLAFRGSYSTAFRVPSFNQIFNGVTLSPYAGSDIADPVKCPGGVPTSSFGSGLPCAQVRPDIATGGNLALGPETAKMYSVGAVLSPAPRWTFSADYWSIAAENTIVTPTLRQLIDNAALFQDRFARDGSGTLVTIDDRWANAGSRRTRGIEFALRGGFPMGAGSINLGADATYLLEKREKVVPTAPYTDQLGVFTYAGDLGLRWKHNAWIGYSDDTWSATLTQIFRGTYANQKLPGVANGTVTRPDFNAKVSPYSIFNLSVSYLALRPNFKITAGVKNILDTDPPFAITYDGNTGAGSSWEPRVADPRGRAFTLQVEVKY
ncbi:TonB-dependent receptor domain-containing protein [Parablastomonas sp. CN1-191]|uniref:TonB-dependent receptor domain-containing protein n=1 Tax=Parablastomonas sp. CN1-191 TaxID=3400908 RepID=UPI003BF7C318